MTKGEKSCYICSTEHHKGIFCFPRAFPNEWKWCCNCLRIAQYIVRRGFDYIINLISNCDDKIEEIVGLLELSTKINKMINIE